MADEQNERKRRRESKRNDPRTLRKFIQELSWLLSTYSDLDFRALDKFAVTFGDGATLPSFLERYAPKNTNVLFLVGALPHLFVDERLFRSNEDIAEFAESALSVKIPRWKKKSRFELIGHVVCNATKLNDESVSQIVIAMGRVIENDSQARRIVEGRKESGMSWNEIIQLLTSQRA